MGYILNFVYDDWDEVKNIPRYNRLKSIKYPNNLSWEVSSYPMDIFENVEINNRRIEEIEIHPNEVFYYYVRIVWDVGSFDWHFINGLLPIDSIIVEKINNNNNLFLLLMNECEIETKDSLERLTNIVKSLGIDEKKVWFVNNNAKLNEYREELNSKINVHTTNLMSNRIRNGQRTDFVEKKESGSFFLCMNRTPKIHRYALLSLLKKHKILEDTNWSLISGWDFKYGEGIFKDILNDDDISDLIDEIKYMVSFEVVRGKYESNYLELLDRTKQNLPFEPKSFENSYFNIVTESNYVSKDIHVTEKSFKPFFHYQFPLILASYNHIKYFRSVYPEYDFFDDVINHSYDNIENNRNRLFAFFNEIKKIHENKNFFIDFYKKNKDRFIKNHECLTKTSGVDHNFFKKLINVKYV